LNDRAKRFTELLAQDSDAKGRLYDARICNDISIDLYNLRRKSGLTQKELAEKLGVKQSNISRWEKPGYQGYKVKMLSKVARLLGSQLFISVQPVMNIQYFKESFEMQHETSVTKVNTDGSMTKWSKKFKVNYEGVSVNASL
jgi:transcriptional regulator with XRE-family HTH domain